MRSLCLFVLIAGCSTAAAPERIRSGDLGLYSSAEVLTAADLSKVDAQASTTIDAVMRLRPNFLSGSLRTPVPIGGIPEIAVYLNNNYDGDTQSLASIPLRAIQQIIFMHAGEARIRFGQTCRCAQGAIVVTTVKAQP